MPGSASGRRRERAGWLLTLPALGTIAAVALFPLSRAVYESLRTHDLRMPWKGTPFVGLGNYLEIAGNPRFWRALGHTLFFAATSVTLELLLGLALALLLDRTFRGRGLVRAAVLAPWALPTVVAALVWRFMFESRAGIVNAVLAPLGIVDAGFVWFAHPVAAWVPVVLADVWKTTPFVTLLLLAGLQAIDRDLYEAARVDGAGRWRSFVSITLPLLGPAILVASIFRTLDALRVFDLIYVMTGGGPGTATEPLALLTFDALFSDLRFGYGSALSVVLFLLAFGLALAYVRALGKTVAGEGP